jgi:membrane-bound lytic murein transglycosylase D
LDQRAQSPTDQPQSAAVDQPEPEVRDFYDYFRGAGHIHFEASLARLALSRPQMEQVFADEGIPRNLIWVGLVESGYQPTARSPQDARGLWQLMPGTAHDYGLATRLPDERLDPLKSTRAAARYLRDLRASFGDWNLALAAYNAGANRVEEAIRKGATRDFWRLARMGFLPRETRGYVPAVLAAQMLGEGGDPAGPAQVNATPSSPSRRIVYALIGTSPQAGQ